MRMTRWANNSWQPVSKLMMMVWKLVMMSTHLLLFVANISFTSILPVLQTLLKVAILYQVSRCSCCCCSCSWCCCSCCCGGRSCEQIALQWEGLSWYSYIWIMIHDINCERNERKERQEKDKLTRAQSLKTQMNRLNKVGNLDKKVKGKEKGGRWLSVDDCSVVCVLPEYGPPVRSI